LTSSYDHSRDFEEWDEAADLAYLESHPIYQLCRAIDASHGGNRMTDALYNVLKRASETGSLRTPSELEDWK
jgi:hypothetical protein